MTFAIGWPWCWWSRPSASLGDGARDIRHAVGMTEEPKGRAVPSGDTTPALPSVISVMLIVPDADGAVAWYKTALDATELWNLGGVAGREIGGGPFFLHEVNPANPVETSPGQAGSRAPVSRCWSMTLADTDQPSIADGAGHGAESR
jgi:PhnB protein